MNFDYCFFFKYLLKFFFLVYLQYRNNLLHINFTYNEIILLKYLKTHKPKKVVLFQEIGRVKKIFHSPARIVECVSEYIFLISKNKKKTKKSTKKAKEIRVKPG